MWKKLSNLPRHEHNHAFLLKHFGCADIVRSWFDSTSNFDTQFHCDHPGSGYCSRRICKLLSGKLLAVCNDDEAGCADLQVTKSDIRLHSLNLSKIAGVIAELTKDAFIYADVQTIGETISCIRIGHYMPRGTIRYPVFLGVAIYDGDTDSVISYLLSCDKPAIMLLPSIEDVPQAKINAIKSKGSALLGLQTMQGDDSLIDAGKIADALTAFHESLDDPMPDVSCELFPTPPKADWSNISIKFTDGHTVRATCNSGSTRVSQVYNFTQMGMADGRTASPNKQWILLEGFADERGQFTWENSRANRNQKKQKQELKKVLQKFFGIYDSDPFEDFKDHKNRICYRSKFNISPDE